MRSPAWSGTGSGLDLGPIESSGATSAPHAEREGPRRWRHSYGKPAGVKTVRGNVHKHGRKRWLVLLWNGEEHDRRTRTQDISDRASQVQLQVVVEVDSLLSGNLALDVETGLHRALGDQVDCSQNDLVQSVWERILPRGAVILYVDSR